MLIEGIASSYVFLPDVNSLAKNITPKSRHSRGVYTNSKQLLSPIKVMTHLESKFSEMQKDIKLLILF